MSYEKTERIVQFLFWACWGLMEWGFQAFSQARLEVFLLVSGLSSALALFLDQALDDESLGGSAGEVLVSCLCVR